ncbi:MAG: hypothetical protein HN475_09630 [Piscirickettsiaceae bacterium]|nr:hypothetical protein [Piscirickettsiaceae bacterium]
MKLTFAAIALLIPSLILADDLEPGEKLMTEFGPEFSDYGMYQPFTMNEHDTYFRIWKSVDRGFSDHYAVNIGKIEKTTTTLDSFKASQDEPAQRTCQAHTSSPAEKTMINGYDAISWKSTCELGKLTITSIEMAIMGNDHFYHLRKLWKFPISDEKVSEWQMLLSQTSVCDTTNNQHACPAE